ncbi:hypothetical protein [Rheinheimera sp. UJ63]|uniref:hypothetical protein n=1 Tax=Rheinheimera sp. UJ63 TaxID=2910157 RepID=UPI001F25CC3C|nr:hypothetical protein [Rheinheimera sp. UJ63]MCF4008846.1 hypothetical protein [Rheinheimera sp. UJ63]
MHREETNQLDFVLLSEMLEQQYCITFNDTGYTKAEWLDRFGDMPMNEAISAYADKYNLTPIKALLKFQI